MKRNFWLVAPYAAWMVLMAVLPATAAAYAVRGAVTALLLVAGWWRLRPAFRRCGVLSGLLTGVAVFFVWTAPEAWLGFAPSSVTDSPYAPAVCGWTLTVLKLLASAFVISAAEELFFRRWLVDFAGFWWMVALFAVEHGDRWFVGALAGIAYGGLARRYGLLSAIVAHAVTNLVLGLYAIFADKWFYWS